jgi:hypothetical protein
MHLLGRFAQEPLVRENQGNLGGTEAIDALQRPHRLPSPIVGILSISMEPFSECVYLGRIES